MLPLFSWSGLVFSSLPPFHLLRLKKDNLSSPNNLLVGFAPLFPPRDLHILSPETGKLKTVYRQNVSFRYILILGFNSKFGQNKIKTFATSDFVNDKRSKDKGELFCHIHIQHDTSLSNN